MNALDVGAHEPEMDRQPLLPSVAFEPQRDLLDRLHRVRDPSPAEDALPVGDEPVDAELEYRVFELAHDDIGGRSAHDVEKGFHSSGGA